MKPKGIERVTKAEYERVRLWYKKRGKKAMPFGLLPPMGYMCDKRVAGWLYTTDGNLAIIEGIIADPDTIPSYRRQSMRKLSAFLVDMAVALGYSTILGITTHPSTDKMAKEFGFTQQEANIWTLSDQDGQ